MREPEPDHLLKPVDRFKWTETLAQKALCNCLDVYKHKVFPNVMLGAGEMDLAVLSARRYLTEIEIKLTRADWQADKLKQKWLPKNASQRSIVKYFAYAVPVELMNAMPEDIDPHAGIVCLFWDHLPRARDKQWKIWGQWAKQPTAIPGAQPLSDEIYQQLMVSMYHRYWRQIQGMSVFDERLLPVPEPQQIGDSTNPLDSPLTATECRSGDADDPHARPAG